MSETVTLDLNETIECKRALVYKALEYIGKAGTGVIPFKEVAELVAALQESVQSPAIVTLPQPVKENGAPQESIPTG